VAGARNSLIADFGNRRPERPNSEIGIRNSGWLGARLWLASGPPADVARFHHEGHKAHKDQISGLGFSSCASLEKRT